MSRVAPALLLLAACALPPSSTGAVPAAAGPGLRITRLAVCDRVDGYRDFVESRRPARPGEVILLYAEMEGFAMAPEANDTAVALRYSWELWQGSGGIVDTPDWRVDPGARTFRHVYRGPIRDCHQWFRLRLPSDLAAGAYRVRVVAEDLNAGRSDAASVPLSVAFD